MEWKLISLSVYALCKHNKTKWKSSFDLRIQSQIFLAYYYFIPGNATKICHHPSCTWTLVINGRNCLMVHARSLTVSAKVNGSFATDYNKIPYPCMNLMNMPSAWIANTMFCYDYFVCWYLIIGHLKLMCLTLDTFSSLIFVQTKKWK